MGGKLLEALMTWHEGRLKCQEMGGEMVVPSSSEETNYLLSKLENGMWINCNDLEIEGQWDCTPDNGGYMNWNKEEPNGETIENCAELETLSPWGNGSCMLI